MFFIVVKPLKIPFLEKGADNEVRHGIFRHVLELNRVSITCESINRESGAIRF
jgi:hypothetical protein